MKDRDITLDVLRGIGIFLVVFAHTNNSRLSSVIYTFHMPLFFLISGCAQSYSRQRQSVGFMRYVQSLVVPYFAFSLITFVYWVIIEWRFRPSDLAPIYSGSMGLLDVRLQEFLNIFTAYSVNDAFEYNIVMWFLPCLFCCMVIYKWLKLHTGQWLSLCVIGLATLYFLTKEYMPVLPWCLEISFVALPFVWVGDKCYALVREKNSWGLIIAALLIIIGGLLFINPHVDMRAHSFPELWIFYPVALSFIYLTIKICGIISHYECAFFQWMGRNSLLIMCIHDPLKRIVLKLTSVISGVDISVIRESVVASFLLVIIIVSLIIPVVFIVNRHMPFIIGKDADFIKDKI